MSDNNWIVSEGESDEEVLARERAEAEEWRDKLFREVAGDNPPRPRRMSLRRFLGRLEGMLKSERILIETGGGSTYFLIYLIKSLNLINSRMDTLGSWTETSQDEEVLLLLKEFREMERAAARIIGARQEGNEEE